MPNPRNYKRVVLITGATEGIGKQLALELASGRYEENGGSTSSENFVILHGRTRQKCEETIEWINRENKVKYAENLGYLAADFTRLDEVAHMADEVKLRFPRLNAMVCCASILVPRRHTTHDGYEMTIQVNYLSHYVLWHNLLPLLEANAPSRLVTVGSKLYSINSIDWTDLMCERCTYNKFQQFSQSKLMNHLATYYIHRLLFQHGKQFQVTANVVEVDERIERRPAAGSSFNVFSASESHLNTIHKSTTAGVQTLVRLVEHPSFAGISGKYFDASGREIRKNADVGQVRLQDQLWEVSGTLCAKVLRAEVNGDVAGNSSGSSLKHAMANHAESKGATKPMQNSNAVSLVNHNDIQTVTTSNGLR